MTALRETLRCRYQYDPLDRVVGCTPLNRDSVQRFYRNNRLATEIQGQAHYSVFEHEAQLLAQRRFEADRVDWALLTTDLQRSVLHSLTVGQHQQPVYSPYGHRSPEGGLISLLGFNGERRDPVTGHYLLGNGYRAFNPVLMRFNSPDSLSPFGRGGVNAYAYCGGDPLNRVDPMGHYFAPALVTGLARGAMARRVFNIVDQVISVPTAAVNKVVGGFSMASRRVGNFLDEASGARRNRLVDKKNEAINSLNDFKASSVKEFKARTGQQVTFDKLKEHAQQLETNLRTQEAHLKNFGPFGQLSAEDAEIFRATESSMQLGRVSQERVGNLLEKLHPLEFNVYRYDVKLNHPELQSLVRFEHLKNKLIRKQS